LRIEYIQEDEEKEMRLGGKKDRERDLEYTFAIVYQGGGEQKL
jgi:hypothetical protein